MRGNAATVWIPWRLATVVALMLAVLGIGCTPSTLALATRTANGTADVMDRGQAILAESYEAEQRAAVDAATSEAEAKAAVATIRARYKPAWEAYRSLRHLWLAFAATIEGRKLGRYDDRELAAWLPRLAKAHGEFAKAMEALEGGPPQ